VGGSHEARTDDGSSKTGCTPTCPRSTTILGGCGPLGRSVRNVGHEGKPSLTYVDCQSKVVDRNLSESGRETKNLFCFTKVMPSVTPPVLRGPGAGDLLAIMRDGQPRTRADLAEITGQARSTVSSRVDQLMAAGLVKPVSGAISTGGRPAARLVFNPGARVVLAIDVGASHARLAVTDLSGAVLTERWEQLSIGDGPDVVLPHLAAVGLELVAETDTAQAVLGAAGVGLPAPVEFSTGRPTTPPIMPGWDGADVVGILSGLLGVPVVADNDVNLMALGEHKAAWQEVTHLLFVKVATGIGAGFIDRGSVSRGAHGAAGDIGHIPVAGSRTPCPCGNVGCLEVNASGSALAAQLRQQGYDVSGSDDVVALVRTGNVAAAQAVRQAGRDIGDILAACVSMMNPSMIVIGGSLSEAGEHLLAGIREVVYSRSLPLASRHLRVVATQTKGQAGILGASSLAADLILQPSAVDQLVNALPASASSA